MFKPDDLTLEPQHDYSVNFSCNGCGRCCHGHHLPLTLAEAKDWSDAGGQIIIFTEAFHHTGQPLQGLVFEHAAKRAALVESGTSHVYVIVTFAAFNPGKCRNLQDDNRCGIYEQRPLVCRIYPAEINPHIRLNQALKDCPDEVWHSTERLIFSDGGLPRDLAELVESSRQADRAEAGRKVWISQQLGIADAAWKGDGMMAWLPDTGALSRLLLSAPGEDWLPTPWNITVDASSAVETLRSLGIDAFVSSESSLGAYIAFPKSS